VQTVTREWQTRPSTHVDVFRPPPGGEMPPPQFPPGLVGEVAQFIMAQAPRPVPEIALAGAVGFLAGITGRAYNISGTGLNQYVLLLAGTGTGKDAIASGVSKLMTAIKPSVPSAADFRGPGELVSSAGLIKWLAKNPATFCVLGEFGKSLKAMSGPRANPNLAGLARVILQLYSKSGEGNVLDPIAYSDATKNTPFVNSPSLTILGESVPEAFYESLDEGLIADGLLPRFMVFEYLGERVARNKLAEVARPSAELVEKLGILAAQCLNFALINTVHHVLMDESAEAKFDEFDAFADRQINSKHKEVARLLWNRAHLKALKLAALSAVGRDFLNPIIGLSDCMWATTIVATQTQSLIDKFETGEVGDAISDETKQIDQVIRCIAEYAHGEFESVKGYGVMPEMHRDNVVPENYLSRRLINLPLFKNDKRTGTGALKAAIKHLTDSNELQQISPSQMSKTYHCAPISYVLTNPERFVEAILRRKGPQT
jgi:hypothetical protein